MAEDKRLPLDPEATLQAVCNLCMERLPDCAVTGEVIGANENDLQITILTKDGDMHTTKVRMSLAKPETATWLDTIEQHS